MLKEATESLTFPLSMKQEVITLIPKPDKDPKLLDNFRPVFLKLFQPKDHFIFQFFSEDHLTKSHSNMPPKQQNCKDKLNLSLICNSFKSKTNYSNTMNAII